MIKNLVYLSIIISSSSFAGSVLNLGTAVQVENNLDSELTQFKVTHNDYRVSFGSGGKSFGTKMIAEYKTKNLSSLEDYAVVQYIKGCVFDSRYENGTVTKVSNKVTQSFGELIPFKYNNWTIDTVDTDPVYASIINDRHGRYRWNTSSGYNHKTQNYYREKMPSKPSLYIRDIPATASVYGNSAVNVSLQFKVCIMRVADIPLTVSSPTHDMRSKALKCMEWDSSFIYNHVLKSYESKPEIDDYCR